jgi:ABC-type transport system substrate-binding protein
LTPLFHQEVPQNTIRILIDTANGRTIMFKHLSRLLAEKKYSYIRHQEDFNLLPSDPKQPILQFQVVKDENTRALIFLKGEADVLYDTLSLAKTEWVKLQRAPKQAAIYSNTGEAVSLLAINSQSTRLQDQKIKTLIREALPLKLWSETIFLNWVEPIDPKPVTQYKLTEKLTLHYLTTPSREGQQMAFLVREALGKIGIDVQIHVYEPSLFYAKIKKREFDLYSSRTLPGTKTILDLPHTETIPLFRWKHGLILSSRVITPPNIEVTLDYSFRFLSELQLSSSP